ncbi:hypothetical protein CANCADRAFT_71204 [Tortispora caseinolytica NRRL Y-17796]|uniref:NADH-cytochrome b5 reductase n=1 Tax=Tortispora caseinolytica NRRL Y-17796 TaxID=767744 RepID=A0A1E4TIF7_9ASCO|nr:hypothetical protein CANCADRAFT_71204 [Tortispora caseinolytica NRRL Y-17796]
MPEQNKDYLLGTPLHGYIIPSFLLIFGTFIVKKEWVGYAAALAAALAGVKYTLSRPRKVLHRTEFQEFELAEKFIVSHNSAIYRFKLPNPNDILGLPIGQHVVLAAECDGTEIMRSYTPITSDDDTRGYVDILIKSYPQGNISKKVASMAIGETIKMRGPKGQFTYQPNIVKTLDMIAGGSGITPMLQIIKAILKNPNDKTKITLIYANVNYDDILLKDDLDALVAKYPDRIKVKYVLNNPPEVWDGYVGFVTTDILKEHLNPPSDDTKVLICGPPPMVSAMKKAVQELGFEKPKPVSKMDHQVFVF